jgi:hypothetical protein
MSPSYALTIFCMITLLLLLLCAIISFLINTQSQLSLAIHHLLQFLLSDKPRNQQNNWLHATHTALLTHRDIISRQIEATDTLLQSLLALTNQHQRPQNTNSPLRGQQQLHSQLAHVTNASPRRPFNNTSRQRSIGRPYLIPFSPPRTPEEVQRNNIIEWLNNIRSRNTNQHEFQC